VLPKLRVVGSFATGCTETVALANGAFVASERMTYVEFMQFYSLESQMPTTILYFLSFYLSNPAFIALIAKDAKHEEKFIQFCVTHMQQNLRYVELQLVGIHCVWGFVSMEKDYGKISHGPNGILG
jgi:hypothetical protein